MDERNADATRQPPGTGCRTVRRLRAAGHSWGLAALAGCLLLFAISGVPFNPETIVLFLTFIVLVDALGRQGVPGVTRVVVDWGPVLAILVFYDLTRGIADSMGMPLQMQSLVDADKLLFFGQVPTVWLQEHILSTKPSGGRRSPRSSTSATSSPASAWPAGSTSATACSGDASSTGSSR